MTLLHKDRNFEVDLPEMIDASLWEDGLKSNL